MPIYEYECEKCSHRFELIQKFSDAPILACPKCQGQVRKIISSPGILFKGSGWYVTDYSKKLKNPAEESKANPVNTEKKSPDPGGSTKEGTSPAPAAPAPTSSEKKSDSAPIKPAKSE